jgi:hypothetical protein
MWNGPDVDSASLVASLAALVRDATEDVGSDNLIGAVAVFLAVVTNDNPSAPSWRSSSRPTTLRPTMPADRLDGA